MAYFSDQMLTGSTTAKQERYEKKMTKYLANKARKEQKENERKNIEMVLNSLMSDVFKKTKEFAEQSDSPMYLGDVINDGEHIGQFGLFMWSKDGKKIEYDGFLVGIFPNSPFGMAWRKQAESVANMIEEYRENVSYIHANSREEALNVVCKELFNEAA